MKVEVLYRSAAFRQAAGVPEETVELEAESLKLEQVLRVLVEKHGEGLKSLLFAKEKEAFPRCFVLINGTSVRRLDFELAGGDRLELVSFSAGG